jgi:hypothetical protein
MKTGYSMFNSFVQIIRRIVALKIIAGFLFLAFAVLFFPWHFMPDYFKLGKIGEKKEIVFKLLSTIIGSSGLMLTLILVGYNFYVKTTRRFTLEFVTDNRWLRFIVSLFFGIVLFLVTGFFFLETEQVDNNTAFLYVAYVVTILFLLSLFPMAVLALHESYSIKKIHKILSDISDTDIDNLYQWQYGTELTPEGIEGHPLLILKDLCISAIADKDWVLPQTVLKFLYNRVIVPLHKDSGEFEVQRATFVWALFCTRLKREVIKHNDITTGNEIYTLSLAIHFHFAENGIIHLRGNKVDEFLQDYLRMILEQNAFYEIQSYFSRDLTDIIRKYFESVHYTDEQIPTMESWMGNRSERTARTSREQYSITAQTNLWFYLTKELPTILFETIEVAIDLRRKAVYEVAFWNMHHTMDSIFNAEKLTVSQKRNAIKEFLYKTRQLSDYALGHQIYNYIEPASDIQIQTWFTTDSYLGFDALFSYKRMIVALIETNAVLDGHMDRFFMVGRFLLGYEYSTIDEKLLNEVVDYILELGVNTLKRDALNPQIRRSVLYQVNWFQNDYLNDPRLQLTKDKYNDQISTLLERYADQIPKYG